MYSLVSNYNYYTRYFEEKETKKHQIKAFRTSEGKKKSNIQFLKYYLTINNSNLFISDEF